MTRRKRTSSPSPSPSTSQNQKRVAFEIPASLQQFSTISRSLATTPGSKTPTTSVKKTQSQPRPTSQSPSYPRPSLPATTSPNRTHVFVPQKRSFPDAQPWPQPVPKNQAYSAASRHGGKPVNQPKASPPATMSQARPAPRAPASPQQRSASNPGLPTVSGQEPPLKPGEAPNLKTHPNLIASLVAQKRAENDAMGFRERWARKQAEYRMSKSPANQLNHELHQETVGSNNKQNQSRSASNPLPARSAPAAPQAKPSAPVIIEVDTPTAETVSTPPTEDSRKRKRPSEDQRPNEDDSLFESPFSSPIEKFLERATDDAGLKDGAERNATTPARSSMAGTPTVPPRDQQRQHISQVSNHPDPPGNSSIPPLFSDKPYSNQSRSQSKQAVQSNMYNNSHTVMQQQQQPYPNSSMPMQNTTNQSIAYGPQSQTAPRPSLAPPHPYNARGSQSIPGYYKTDMGQYYNNTASPAASSSPSPNYGTSQAYGKSPAPMGMTYPSYNIGGNPYMYALPPAPGALPTYGATMVASAAAEQTKTQHSDPGLMTAADMVAGVNTKFRISTKDGFAVPKWF
ncbi:hypothetical protein H2202_006321 [Exophiala xenobiotica]|nr:hypothetical protein H2202_006321 [Exophiala xenobiotica]